MCFSHRCTLHIQQTCFLFLWTLFLVCQPLRCLGLYFIGCSWWWWTWSKKINIAYRFILHPILQWTTMRWYLFILSQNGKDLEDLHTTLTSSFMVINLSSFKSTASPFMHLVLSFSSSSAWCLSIFVYHFCSSCTFHLHAYVDSQHGES